MRRLSTALLILAAVIPSWAAPLQTPVYTQFVTDDSIVYMDERGVAVRIEKLWACRRRGWARASEPLVMTPGELEAFKTTRIPSGDWADWICDVTPGKVTYSRGIEEAQRKLNAAQDKLPCTPHIPETGRNNWEMLEYTRCRVADELANARRELDSELAARLEDYVHAGVPAARIQSEPKAVIAELTPKAKAIPFGLYVNECDSVPAAAFELAQCGLAAHEGAYKEAQRLYAAYAGRVARFRGGDAIPQAEMNSVRDDALAVRRRLKDSSPTLAP